MAGSWKGDKKHGLGAYSYANGDTYKGEWVMDQKDGVGTYVFEDSKSQVKLLFGPPY